MRALNLIPLLAITISTILSAQPKSAVITGTLRGSDAATMRVQYHRTLAEYAARDARVDSSAVAADGRYAIVLDVERPTLFELYAGDRLITYNRMVRPGDTVEVDVTASNDTLTIEIGGTAELLNDYLAAHQDRFERDSTERALRVAARGFEMNDFARFIEVRRKRQQEFFEEYWKGRQPPVDLVEFTRSNIEYESAFDRLQYLWMYPRMKRQAGIVRADSAYFAPILALSQRELTPAASRRAVNFLRELFYILHEDSSVAWMARGDTADVRMQYPSKFSMARSMLSGDTRNLALTSIITEWLRVAQMMASSPGDYATVARSVEGADSLLGELRRLGASSVYTDVVERAIVNARRFAPGTPAPPLALMDVDGRTVSLEDLRGKVVYLEFWATNCGPCITELPKTKELQKKFKGRDVAFVYVSLDTRDDVWRRFLKNREFSGIHLRAQNGFVSDAARAYDISGIPRYILIDREGRLLSNNAPRPSHGIDSMLDALLNDKK